MMKKPRPQLSCYQKALSLLGMRAYSEYKLTQKLQQLSYEPTEINSALERLRELNLLNDEQLAARKTDQWQQQGFGPLMRQQKKMQLGLSDTNTAPIDPELEIELAWQYLTHKKKSLISSLEETLLNPQNNSDHNEIKEKIFRHLAYRGHSFRVIQEVWKKLETNLHS